MRVIFEAAGTACWWRPRTAITTTCLVRPPRPSRWGAAPLVDPTISAAVGSVTAPRNGWVPLGGPCRLHLHGGARAHLPCPAPVFLRADGADQSVSRTVTALDGGWRE